MKSFINKFLCTLAVLFTLVACDEQLDLADPANVGEDIALSNDKNVKATLVGAYDALANGNLFGGITFLHSELLASNGEIVFSGTFNDPADIWRKSTTTVNANAAATWLQAYDAINICNNVLSALDVVNEEDRDQVEGEALFIRGVTLFELVQFYAKPYSEGNAATNPGVPIMLVEDRNSTELVSRATVAEVYTQVISDLTTAENKLTSEPVENRASKEVAAAFLSRVYLQMADYANARDAANRVITSGHYALNATIAEAFNTGTTAEDVFDVPVSTADGANNMQLYYASAANAGRGDVEIQTKHLNLYDAADDRLDLYYADGSTGETRTGKWVDQFGNVKIIRLAEMYLTRAESNQRLGTAIGDTPLNDVNLVRARVSLPPLGAVTLADILRERRLELAHEGARLHDAKRLMESITEGTTVYSFDAPELVFPIPQREINVNINLEQNEGYF